MGINKTMMRKIKKALISVSDKKDLKKILKTLTKYKVKIISSGGTYKEIKKLKYKCLEISDYTNSPEILGGRVKTLHPKIHAGILSKRKNKSHQNDLKKQNFEEIDLVIVNFYPFEETINLSKNHSKIIEKIDVGGPTMVRAAAKNYNDVTVITSTNQYNELINELDKYKGSTSLNFREKMSLEAFSETAYYDAVISNYFNKLKKNNFPKRKIIYGNLINKLRYGENPHQESAIYSVKNSLNIKQIYGKQLSYNNYNDIFSGLEILGSLNKTATVIIKHANPSGVSMDASPLKSFKNALSCDPVSAFGGIVACNFNINKKIAEEISKTFFEVILAKKFDKEALKILLSKKKLILIDISKFKLTSDNQIKSFDNSFLIQDKNHEIFNFNKLKFVTKLKPSKRELKCAEFAMNVCKFVKSNSIVVTKDFSTIGIGAGQPSRVDSCKIAVEKARIFQPKKMRNSIAASDAFFPFPDGIKKLVKSGVKLIVQPGGSIRDKESILVADKAKVKMVFTGTRHFNH